MTASPEPILVALNGTLRNRSLYPASHPAIKASTKKSYSLLSGYLAGRKQAFFGLVNDVYVFDEYPLIDAPKMYVELTRRMSEKNIEAIIFLSGFTEEEFGEVLNLIYYEQTADAETIRAHLKSRGVTRITLKILERNPLELYDDAISAVKSVMGELRLGRIPSAEEVKGVVQEMTDTILSDPNAMIGLTMIKGYDDYLFTHCVNVGVLSISLAKAMGLSDADLQTVGVGAVLHDIGKTAVSADIIKKPGGLSESEWEKLKAHPVMGSNIAKEMEGMDENITRIIYEHHTKYDHSGYPPISTSPHPLTQIVTIADAYDALTTLRVYQRPYQPLEAINMMKGFSGTHFDPEVLNHFIGMIGFYPVGTVVQLATNELGVVTKASAANKNRPTIKVVFDKSGAKLETPVEIEISADSEGALKVILPEDPLYAKIDVAAFFENESRRGAETKEGKK
jgi:putative nucleotidyltransferase with HDIG domain